jgi:DNA-binding phage protein
MATTSQERLFEILMVRVRNDRYPSHQLLNRIEESLWTSEQVVAYVDMLLEKIDEAWYPSLELLDRVERMMALAAIARRAAA